MSLKNNKVVLSDGTTLMDITDTTATAEDVKQGKNFYLANGEKVAGTFDDSWVINDASNLFRENARLDIMNELLSRVKTPTNIALMFYNCTSLTTSIDLSSIDGTNLTEIRATFSGCTEIKNIDCSFTITNTMSEISSAFYNCRLLESVKIGDDNSVYGVQNSPYLFYNCASLRNVEIRGQNVLNITNSNAFSGLYGGCVFKVPSNLVDQYKRATNWSARAAYITSL